MYKKYKIYIINSLVFILGISLMLIGKTCLIPNETISHGLTEAGLFLSVSVVSHLIYMVTIKKEDQHELRDILDEQAYFKSNGLNKIHSNFSYNDIFNSLQKNDKLSWAITWVPDFYNYRKNFIDAIQRSVSIRLLLIDPYSKNAKNRSNEIIKENLPPPSENFFQTITQLNDEIDNPESFDVRIYDDLPCLPMFIIERKSGAKFAYTGFYVRRRLSSFIFLEWKHVQKENSPVFVFEEYFNHKWSNSEPLKNHKKFLGKWNYIAIDKHDINKKAYGTCEFIPGDSGGFKVNNGKRSFRTKVISNVYSIESDIANWSTLNDFYVAKIDDNKYSILLNYQIDFGQGNAKGVCEITYTNIEDFIGTFHIYDIPESDPSNPIEGSIQFSKQPIYYKDSNGKESLLLEGVN